jgi:hypothetical protein
MTLANYINDLLYRYDCVIVPNFGGFVTNAISAKVNHFSHTFHPPTKQITFNSHLKNNDGLLANYIASSENISFEKANEKIAGTVKNWKIQLHTESVCIDLIGSFSLNSEQQITFEPTTVSNYLTETFGMAAVSSPAIKRIQHKNQSEKLAPVITHKRTSSFFKYAATAAVVFTIGLLGWNQHQNNELQAQYTKQQLEVEQKIQSATFIIDTPLPTIQLTISKETPKNFHIIAGCFQFKENAEKKRRQLKAKGFKAVIIGENKWGLTQVTYSSYETRAEAYRSLKNIRYNFSEDAWLLVKKLQ